MATNVTLGEFFDANMGNLWVQIDGPNTIGTRLACHDLDDIDEPFGDITQRHCPDPSGPGKWKVIHVTQAPPDRVTTSITVPVGKTSDGLEAVEYPMPLYIHMSRGGDRRNFLNYERGFRIRNSRYDSKGLTNLLMREESDQSEMSFGVSGDPPLDRYWPMVISRLTTLEALNLLSLAVANSPQPPGPLGAALKAADRMIAGAKSAPAAASANALLTLDRGNLWTAMAADPFPTPGGENLAAAVSFPVSRTLRRHVFARGLTDAAAPAEIAYSDNDGVSWSLVNVGATVGTFFSWGGSLFSLPEDKTHVWAGLSNGDIFFSSDGCQSWTEQVTPNTSAIHAIHFANDNYGVFVGAGNTIYKTEDGGLHWSALVGPSAKAGVIIRAAAIINSYTIWIAYTDGDVYFTTTGGVSSASWTKRTLPGVVTGIGDMAWLNEYDGFMVGYSTISAAHYPWFARTFDGGYTWETANDLLNAFTADPTTVTEGLNKLVAVGMNRLYAVGDVSTATATIYAWIGQ